MVYKQKVVWVDIDSCTVLSGSDGHVWNMEV